jgi:hypothetical protein
LPPLLIRDRKRRAIVERNDKADARLARPLPELGVVRFHLLLVTRVERPVVGGDAEIRRALEDEEMSSLLRDQRDRLDRGGAGADDGDPLAAEVDALMWPVAGLVPFALEPIEPREGRRLRCREAARRHDREPRRDFVAAVRPNSPAGRRFVECGFGHAGRELDVAPQVEPVGDMVDVFQDFRLRRVALGPAPFLLEIVRERVGIIHAFDVAARAGIPVPVPGAANAVPRLEDPGREPQSAQPVQHVEPGKPGSDDNRVHFSPHARHLSPSACADGLLSCRH